MSRSEATGEAVRAILVMGVSGCGKSTIGAMLAGRLDWAFRDADDFHPPENVARMRAGQPLTDADRDPWLAAIGAFIDEALARERRVVVTCSALRRAYRDRLLDGRAGARLVFLEGSRETIAGRLSARLGHFMPESLLASQLATLEPPADPEFPVRLAIGAEPREIVAAALAALGLVGKGG